MTHPRNLPLYQCFKQVHAAKIARIQTTNNIANGEFVHTLHFVDPNIGNVNISNEALRKHQPKDGWYYVVYDDGYESFSPPDKFEAGYFRLQQLDPSPRIRASYLAQRSAEAMLTMTEELCKERVRTLEVEAAESHYYRGRLVLLLERIANALYGKPIDSSHVHSWNDLPTKALELREAADDGADELTNAGEVLMDPPGDMEQSIRNLFLARGAEIQALGDRLRDAGRLTPPEPPHPFKPGTTVKIKDPKPGEPFTGWRVWSVSHHEDQIFYSLCHEEFKAGTIERHQDNVLPA